MNTVIALLAPLIRNEHPPGQTLIALGTGHTRQALAPAAHRIARHRSVARAVALSAAVGRVAEETALALVAPFIEEMDE